MVAEGQLCGCSVLPYCRVCSAVVIVWSVCDVCGGQAALWGGRGGGEAAFECGFGDICAELIFFIFLSFKLSSLYFVL